MWSNNNNENLFQNQKNNHAAEKMCDFPNAHNEMISFGGFTKEPEVLKNNWLL